MKEDGPHAVHLGLTREPRLVEPPGPKAVDDPGHCTQGGGGREGIHQERIIVDNLASRKDRAGGSPASAVDFKPRIRIIPLLPNREEVNLVAFVVIDEGESLESALKRFKRKVQQEAIIKEIKKHSVYFKPGEKKRMKQAQARKRMRRRMKREKDLEY